MPRNQVHVPAPLAVEASVEELPARGEHPPTRCRPARMRKRPRSVRRYQTVLQIRAERTCG
jgi:hypothetical protein